MYRKSETIQKSVFYSLNVFGIFKNPEHGFKYAIVLTCFLFIFLIGSIVGMITCPGLSNKLTVLSIIIPEMAAIRIYIDIFTRRKNLLALLAKMKSYGAPPGYIVSKADVIMKAKLLKYIMAMVLAALLSTAPSTLDSLLDKPITSKYSLMVPYWFSCDDYNRTNVILKRVFCIRVQTKVQLLLSNALQALMGLFMFAIACAGVVIYSIIIYELLVHVDIFKSMVRDLNEIMNRFHPKGKKLTCYTDNKKIAISHYERIVDDKFIAIIKYQQFLKSCVIDIIEMWNVFCTLYVVNYFLTVAILIYIILTEREDAGLLALRAGSLGVFSFNGFLLNCLYGHLISNMNEIIFEELCTIPWYEQNIEFRKLYAIALAQNRKSCRMRVANMVNVDLITIISLIRTTFSILNLMLAVHRSDNL